MQSQVEKFLGEPLCPLWFMVWIYRTKIRNALEVRTKTELSPPSAHPLAAS
jgi:hypothetical protein